MTIDFDQAIRVPFTERRNLPKASGVYVVKQGDTVLYIGRAADIHQRWKKHNQTPAIEQYEGVEIFCFLMPVAELELSEARFIHTLNPALNKLLISTPLDPDLSLPPPLSSLPGFTPLPSDPDEFTTADIAAIFGGDVDNTLHELIRLVHQRNTPAPVPTKAG